MLNYTKRLVQEASKTLTAWLAVAEGLLSQVANHVEDLYSMVPQFQSYLPQSKYTATGIHWIMSGLGLLMIWSRVRRKLKEPAP